MLLWAVWLVLIVWALAAVWASIAMAVRYVGWQPPLLAFVVVVVLVLAFETLAIVAVSTGRRLPSLARGALIAVGGLLAVRSGYWTVADAGDWFIHAPAALLGAVMIATAAADTPFKRGRF